MVEGALLFVPQDKAKEFERWMAKSMWRNALDLMEWNDLMIQVIWDRAWRDSFQIDLITFLGPDEFAAELAQGQALDAARFERFLRGLKQGFAEISVVIGARRRGHWERRYTGGG